MEKNQLFFKTLIPSKSKINVDVWDSVVELFNSGKHKESVVRMFDYINPDINKRFANADFTEYKIPHGSVIVHIKIEGNNLNVKSPFLKLPEKNAIPLLRQIGEINFHPLTLATIQLEGNDLNFKYSTPTHACDPWKMYYVYREICTYADNYDDDFIQKFGAIRFQEPLIQKFDKNQIDTIRNTFQTILKEAEEYIEYFEKKRITAFVWDIVIQTLMKLDSYVAPQGVMRTDIEKTISVLQNKNFSLHEKVEKGKAYLKKLSQIKPEEFEETLYISDVFTPIKFTSNHEDVKSHAQNQYETAKNEMAKADYMGATLSMMYMFLYEFYYYYPEANDANLMTNAMENASGKPWNEAAQILWKAMDDIMTDRSQQQIANNAQHSTTGRNDDSSNAKDDANVKKPKGFLSKLFGK